MPAGEYLAFAVLAAIVIVTPGPDVLLTIQSTAAGGRRAGLATTAGIMTASCTQATLAMTGLAAVLTRAEPVFTAIKYAGAGYLAVLGAQALLAAARPGDGPASPPAFPTPLRRRFTRGLLTNLLNVKVTLFYVAFVPQFLDPTATATASAAVYYAIFLGLAAIWLPVVVVAAESLRRVLSRGDVRRLVDTAFGVTLIGFAYRVLRTQT